MFFVEHILVLSALALEDVSMHIVDAEGAPMRVEERCNFRCAQSKLFSHEHLPYFKDFVIVYKHKLEQTCSSHSLRRIDCSRHTATLCRALFTHIRVRRMSLCANLGQDFDDLGTLPERIVPYAEDLPGLLRSTMMSHFPLPLLSLSLTLSSVTKTYVGLMLYVPIR